MVNCDDDNTNVVDEREIEKEETSSSQEKLSDLVAIRQLTVQSFEDKIKRIDQQIARCSARLRRGGQTIELYEDSQGQRTA